MLQVLRSADEASELAHEVSVEVWRQSARYVPAKGSVLWWVTSMAHRRAVDRVQSVTMGVALDERFAAAGSERDFHGVPPGVENPDVERVRTGMSCLRAKGLRLAYFGGYPHSQVPWLLKVPLGTVTISIRDGLIGLRDAPAA